MLLKAHDKYEQIRQEFNIVTTTTTTHSTTVPGATIHMNVTGTPVGAPVATPVTVSTPAQVAPGLEVRVIQLESNYATLKAEFEAFKAQQALHNQTFDALIKALQAAGQAAPGGFGQVPQF